MPPSVERARPLPHDLPAEQSAIGAVLQRNAILRDPEFSLAADDFYDPRHRAIWDALAELEAECQPIDVIAIQGLLQRSGKLQMAGGLGYLGQLELRCPTADNARHYAGTVQELADRRRLMRAASQIAASGYDDSVGADELRARLAKLADWDRPARARPRRAIEILPELVTEAGLPMISTGFDVLDDLLGGGLSSRTMTELIGPTGSGKTALAAQIAARHADSSPVLFYSGELTAAQLVARIIAQRTGRSWREVLRLELDETTMRDVLAGLDLYVLRQSESPLLDIAAATRELVARRAGMPLVVVDYAQLVADVGENMRLAVMQSVRTLHRLAESTDLAILLLAQGSRASSREMRKAGGNAEDYVDAGAETAQLEQAAANVISLLGSRPEGAVEWDVTAAVSKARYGRTGKAGLRFSGASGRWIELSQLPLTEAEKVRDDDIVSVVCNHRANCERCDGKHLSINAFTETNRHKVAGSKAQISKSVGRVASQGRIRNEGGALLPPRPEP